MAPDGFSFPPLEKCLQKIREEGSTVVLIAPHQQGQSSGFRKPYWSWWITYGYPGCRTC